MTPIYCCNTRLFDLSWADGTLRLHYRSGREGALTIDALATSGKVERSCPKCGKVHTFTP